MIMKGAQAHCRLLTGNPSPIHHRTKTMDRVLDLFSGIGGFSLGLERAGFKTKAFCEIDPWCREILKKHWPDIPIYEDITTLDYEQFIGQVEVITGGFPCQPFSTASRGVITAEDLWPYMRMAINVVLPKYVIAENVSRKAIQTAAFDCQLLGYSTDVRCISAAQAGADHQRDRWWLCAHPHDESQFSRRIDAEVAKLPQLCQGLWGPENYTRAIRVSHGVSDRTHRLRGLGNAVVPQIPEILGKAIKHG